MLDGVESGVVHVRDDTDEFMAAKTNAADEAVGVVDPARNRPQGGLQVDHSDDADPAADSALGIECQGVPPFDGGKAEGHQHDGRGAVFRRRMEEVDRRLDIAGGL